jgi:oligoendopeptidase F
MNNDEDLLKYLQLNTACLLVDDKVWTYISLWGSIDTKTTDIDSVKQVSSTVWSDYKQSTAFFDSELKEFSDEKLDELINNPKFADYKNVFIDIKIQKKRILPEDQQQLVSRLTDGRIASADIHDNLIDGDIEYPVIKDMQ